tara:strand:+ start:1034 stop:2278 length:1245 start_codon:yes stop_codon:yes gene_type:complete
MNFGFVSTRFSGTDGVSLEAQKWADALEQEGHQTFWYSGLSDRPAESSHVVPEAHFEHPDIAQINESVWGDDRCSHATKESIDRLTVKLTQSLREYQKRFQIDVLIPQNALTIPMNLPLGLALARFIEETGIRTIAHHHDFYWERERFSGEAARPYLDRAFPPRHQSIAHVVINSAAARELKVRFGIDAALIPNVMNFETPPPASDTYTRNMKTDLGFTSEDLIFLQPTRVVPRKGIELAIDLVSQLENPSIKLVVSHESGDEGFSYQQHLERLAADKRVDLRFIGSRISTSRVNTGQGERGYTLWDLYPLADFVTYPSLYEGFGNALLETLYFRKPALVNRYPVFIEDIEPLGFDFIAADGTITPTIVASVSSLLGNPERVRKSADSNFELARGHFGYDRVSRQLKKLIDRTG